MIDQTDNETWAKHWSVPVELSAVVRSTVQRQLFEVWNNPRTVKRTGRVLVLPHHLQRPGAAGMYLLTKMGVDLTPLPEDVQRLISSTSCQHRIEFHRPEGEIPRLVYYDGRAMYLGCCDDLGFAGAHYRHVEGEDIRDDERGRARIAFRAPAGWDHVGLFAVPNDRGAWYWPADTRMDDRTVTWADLQEIRFARRQGWAVEVLEKITWLSGRPLDIWADRLTRLYVAAKERGNDVLAGCYRGIALHTIGRLHNLGYRDARSVVQAGDDRATFDSVESIDADGIHIKERVRVAKPADECHPEWSAAIWSRVHLRVARALLSVPRESILAVRGDALYLTDRAPAIDEADDGAVGRLRVKGYVPGPLPAPQTWQELRAAING